MSSLRKAGHLREAFVAKGKREQVRERVIELVEPVLKSEGYELVEVEFIGSSRSSILRVYIDKPGGISLDDCTDVTHVLSPLLDVNDPIESAYDLEISSPGLDRPLRRPADYEKYAGKKVKIKTFGPLASGDNRKVFPGVLVGFESGVVTVAVDGREFSIPHEAIAKANLVYEFED